MSHGPSRHFVVPLTQADYAELEATAKSLGLKASNLAVLVVLRAIHRGGLQRAMRWDRIPKEESIVVRLPNREDHDFIKEHAQQLERTTGRKTPARQLVANLLRTELSKKWFLKNVLGS